MEIIPSVIRGNTIIEGRYALCSKIISRLKTDDSTSNVIKYQNMTKLRKGKLLLFLNAKKSSPSITKPESRVDGGVSHPWETLKS
ncbi:MAG: hypothetical protein SVY10_15105 [Thermodesulfobacteriota bacterium]|nr:hypothetical protein [Thermodesulfobacteriota bacterium]